MSAVFLYPELRNSVAVGLCEPTGVNLASIDVAIPFVMLPVHHKVSLLPQWNRNIGRLSPVWRSFIYQFILFLSAVDLLAITVLLCSSFNIFHYQFIVNILFYWKQQNSVLTPWRIKMFLSSKLGMHWIIHSVLVSADMGMVDLYQQIRLYLLIQVADNNLLSHNFAHPLSYTWLLL